MSAYDEINETPILEVLNCLGIEYDSSRCIKEWGRVTSWRKINLQDNYINDYSNNRAKGSPFAFVKNYLSLSNWETFKWFEENFWITDDDRKKNYNIQRSSNKSFISYRPY